MFFYDIKVYTQYIETYIIGPLLSAIGVHSETTKIMTILGKSEEFTHRSGSKIVGLNTTHHILKQNLVGG